MVKLGGRSSGAKPLHHKREGRCLEALGGCAQGFWRAAEQGTLVANDIFDQGRSHMNVATNRFDFFRGQMQLIFTNSEQQLLGEILFRQSQKGRSRRLINGFPKESEQCGRHISSSVFWGCRIVSSTFPEAIATSINLCIEQASTHGERERTQVETILEGMTQNDKTAPVSRCYLS